VHLRAERVELPDGRVVDDFLSLEMPDYAHVVATTADDRVLVQRARARRSGIHDALRRRDVPLLSSAAAIALAATTS
jgi:hypothetical protein